jgi:tetratricopeptide (TPR) repeat protein
MRAYLILLITLFSLQIYAQEPQLAYQYYRNGDYEKAASIYKQLHKNNTYNTTYFKYLIDCYIQLEYFDEIPQIINKQLEKYPSQEYLFVDLGYNYELQHLNDKANFYYQKALKAIEKTPNLAYLVGKEFQDKHLLENALIAYKKGMVLNPNTNYNFQIAFIYGEKGEVENMFNTYLELIAQSDNYFSTVKTYLGRFITEDPESDYNNSLKRLLLKRNQNNPQKSWNELLSWLYIQQKEYHKALIQEKALYKRGLTDLSGIIELGKITFNNTDFNTAKNCFHYVLENNPTTTNELVSKLFLLEIDMKSNASVERIEAQFQQLFNQYGKTINTLKIQVIYAEFLAFKKDNTTRALSTLEEALKLPLNEFQKGEIKTKIADILVYNNKFNKALIYYTQVQKKLKNHTIGQTARFKIAQTSYFKGDFKWAQSQLKVLKNSTSQLIANDALDLSLLITDNAVKDSLKIALKTYATAELLSYQNKNNIAIATLQQLLLNYKGHPIEDEALFKQAELFKKTNQFEKAESNYLQLIAINKDDILADDATYYLAELYANKLNNIEKAKEYYQKIIFEYPSSIYLVDARKKYRVLRGDQIN